MTNGDLAFPCIWCAYGHLNLVLSRGVLWDLQFPERWGCKVRVPVVFCLLFAMTLSLDAQTGCIQGKVLDTKGAPIPALNVNVSAIDHSFGIEVGTSAEGDFEAMELPAGVYLLVTSDEAKADRDHIDWSGAERAKVAEGDSCSFVMLHGAPRGRLHLHAANALTGQKIADVDGAFRYGKNGR